MRKQMPPNRPIFTISCGIAAKVWIVYSRLRKIQRPWLIVQLISGDGKFMQSFVKILLGQIGLLTFIAFLGTLSVQGAGNSQPSERLLHVHILDPKGKPASGIVAELKTADRAEIGLPHRMDYQTTYVTNRDGKFTVRFDLHDFWDRQTTSTNPLPGRDKLGGRYLVVDPSTTHSGAVSPRIVNSPYPDNYFRNEWGSAIPLGSKPSRVTMRLRKGIEVEGVVETLEGKPVPNHSVQIQHDLHAGTHTGYGAELWTTSTETDRKGRFHFHNVHPVQFEMAAGGSWVETILNGKSIKDNVGRIPVATDAKSMSIVVRLSEGKKYRYYGRVSNEAGKPVTGLRISFGVSNPRRPGDYEDYQDFEHVETDSDGKYQYFNDVPWLRFIKFGKTDFLPRASAESQLPPGKYDYVLNSNGKTIR
ncbi:MAG: hypothetical protein K1X53_04725 [Candidatus Sumerlaeaceae bacterium]|nr:hypothetical protein [Candidatus Sumerlaeaceae bacterium]